MDLSLLDLDTNFGRVVSIKPRQLYTLGKSPLYPLDRRLGGPQSRLGVYGRAKILDRISGLKLRPLGGPARNQSLYRSATWMFCVGYVIRTEDTTEW
jgi:hypothetical protein